MSQATPAEFSKVRSILWPIYRNEVKKFVPMLLMTFFISINYHLLKILKDSLVVTTNASGAEVIPFLKVWAMLPTAVFMTYLFTTLSRHFSRQTVFYVMMGIFLGFFALFTFVLFPLRDQIQPYQLADHFQSSLPEALKGLRGLIDIFRNWIISAFYVMSEMWSAIILSVLFWAFVNEITKISEAKRFYGLLAFGTNMAGFIIGKLSAYCARMPYNEFLPGSNQWEQSLILYTLMLLISGACTVILFAWMQSYVLTDPESYSAEAKKESIEKQKNISLLESFKFLARSRYVMYIALIVLSYNIVINLTEVAWKDQLRQQHADPNQYTAYFSEVTSITGLMAAFMAFVSGYLIRRFGWTFTAMIPPAIMLITTFGFFLFLMFGHQFEDIILALLHTTPLYIAVLFGSAQNVLGRVSKYTLFDATKELSFTPLHSDEKINAKSVIDGIGSRLGKSGGSIMYQVLIVMFSGIAGTTPYVAALICLFIFVWMTSVKSLGLQVEPLIHKK